MSEITSPEPYVGPRPFKRDESEFFFGRTREVNDLVSLITSYQVVLLYAQSGAGKTSLLKASLLPELEREGFVVPEPARVRMQGALEIPQADIKNIFIFNALSYWSTYWFTYLSNGRSSQSELAQMTLATFVARYRESLGKEIVKPLVLIFDQFEEIFTHHLDRWEDREAFFSQVKEALNKDSDLRVYFVMREDYIAELDPYAHILPGKLRTRFRMEQLRRENALEAITGPLAAPSQKEKGLHFAPDVAEALVDDLLKIRVQTGDAEREVRGQFVEPVQLQVVCQALWHALKPEEKKITFDHLRDSGDVNEALTKFYERTLQRASEETGISEGALRRWFDRVMITPDGNRSTVLQGKNDTGGLPNAAIAVFESERLIRAEPRDHRLWYELSQDRLIKPIQNSYKDWLAKQPGEERIRLQLENRAAEWLRSNREKSLLFKQGELVDAKRWVEAERASGSYSDALFALINASEFEISRVDQERDRRLAKEQTLRADAEAARAAALELAAKEESSRAEAEAARAQALELAANEQRARAEEKARSNRKLRFAFAGALAMFAVAMVFAVVARNQQVRAQSNYEQAEENRRTALKNSELAILSARDAQKQREIAESEAKAAKESELKATEASKRAELERVSAVAATKRALAAEKIARDAETTESALKDQAVNAAKEAKKQEKLSTSRELAAHALRQLDIDPELALLLAIKSADIRHLPEEEVVNPPKEARDALMKAIAASRIVSVIKKAPGQTLAAQFDPTSKSVVTATVYGKLETWNVPEERLPERSTKSVQGPTSEINSFAFSADGQFAATTTGNAAQIWPLSDPTRMTVLADKDLKMERASVNDSGSLAVTTSDDLLVRVWDVKAKRIIANLGVIENPVPSDSTTPKEHINSARFSADGNWVIITHETAAYVWPTNAETVAQWIASASVTTDFFPKLLFPGHLKRINSAAISPDNKLVVTVSDDGTGRLWDFNGALKFQLQGHTGPVTQANFSPDSAFVVTAGADNTARIWDTNTGSMVGVLRGHSRPVVSASFSSDGKYVVTVSLDGTTRIWDSKPDPKDEILNKHKGQLRDVAISPDGSFIATASNDGTARIWDMTGKEKAVLRGHDAAVEQVIISAKGNYIATAGSDDSVRLWNPKGDPGLVIKQQDAVADIAFSPNEKLIAVGFFNKGIEVWNIAEEKKIATFDSPDHQLPTEIVFSPDNAQLASAYYDPEGTVRLWTIATGQSEAFPTNHLQKESVLKGVSTSFSNDGKRLAVATASGATFVWDLARLKADPLRLETRQDPFFTQVLFSSDDKYIVTWGDKIVWVWDAATGQKLFTLYGYVDSIVGVAISKNNYYLITAGDDAKVLVWDISTGENLAEFSGHADMISGVAISPDNSRIVTASLDTTARIIRCDACASIEQVLPVALNRPVDQSTRDKLEQFLTTASGLCPECSDLSSLLKSACQHVTRTFTTAELINFTIKESEPTKPCPVVR